MSQSDPMTCAEAEPLLDAFVDAELSGATLRAVGRHAAACEACDGTLRELVALHDAVERDVAAQVADLDLSGVWPRLAPALRRLDGDRVRRTRWRAVPAWGAALAAAAVVLLWLQAPTEEPVRTAARPRANQAVIERLDSDARLEVRRERRDGTMLIMVNATESVP